MDILKDKTDEELNNALLAELAKSRNENSIAQSAIRKANGRLSFLLAVVNELVNRKQIKGSKE